LPELPEVETVKIELSPYVIGRCVTGITLFWEGMIKEPTVKDFCSGIIGQKLTGIARRGKYLLFSLSGSNTLVIHLKMTGSLLVQPNSLELPKFTRAVLHLDNNTDVVFRDPRKFGMMRLVKDSDDIVGKLGPEPLETSFTSESLAQLLTRRKAPIKALLCEQNIIAGIGSMYADEALFASGIHPLRSGDSLSREEVERLYNAIRQVLWSGIGRKGASVNTYFRPDGTKGTAHFEFKVAHCGKKPCAICSTPIERIVVRGRGTYFCPKCQPEKF
jgi:formamidopyrimidine-DNA glycosylase